MTGGWLTLEGGRHVVLGRNIVDLDLTEHSAGFPHEDRWSYHVNAFDVGGISRVVWRSEERGLNEHLGFAARSEATVMLRTIAEHFATDRSGALA